MTEIIKIIPFEINTEKLIKDLMVNYKDDKNELLKMIEEVKNIAIPCAVYREVYITDKGEDYIVIDNYKLESRILRKNIGEHSRVFIYAITVGKEIEKWAEGKKDILESYWADEIQKKILNSAVNYLYKKLDKLLGSEITAEMNPGSLPDWPIEEQSKLFSLLGNLEEEIGLRLTDSFLMLPAKSVSGIKFPTESKYENCQLCQRENCPTRRASFDQKRKDELIKSL